MNAEVTVEAGGAVTFEETPPTGIAIKPGVTLWANAGNIFLYGYLAKDK